MDRNVFRYKAQPDLSGVLMVARRFIAGEGERLQGKIIYGHLCQLILHIDR